MRHNSIVHESCGQRPLYLSLGGPMRRVHMVPLLLVAVLALSAGTSWKSSRKGVRAVIVHGVGVPSHIRFGDMEQASAIYNSFVRVMHTAPRELDRESFRHRPCLGFAVYGMK